MHHGVYASMAVAALLLVPGAHAQAVTMVGRAAAGNDSAPAGVRPQVRSSVVLDNDREFRVTYRYEVTNGPEATQAMAGFLLMAVQPITVRNVPEGWRMQNSPSGVSFAREIVDQRLAGIPPGETVSGPVVEGPVLPGVIRARTLGTLSRTAFVDLQIIGPAIPIGAREPELRFDVVLANVSAHYGRELISAAHPDAGIVTAIFAQIASAGAVADDPAVRDGLRRIRELRTHLLADPWHRELSEALAICAQAMLDGSVPVRAAIP
jgi:hypothetical protein